MKNAFEIRTEVLEMAKDYLDKQYELNLFATKKLIELNKKTVEDLPNLYTPKELLDKATEFYAFINNR